MKMIDKQLLTYTLGAGMVAAPAVGSAGIVHIDYDPDLVAADPSAVTEGNEGYFIVSTKPDASFGDLLDSGNVDTFTPPAVTEAFLMFFSPDEEDDGGSPNLDNPGIAYDEVILKGGNEWITGITKAAFNLNDMVPLLSDPEGAAYNPAAAFGDGAPEDGFFSFFVTDDDPGMPENATIFYGWGEVETNIDLNGVADETITLKQLAINMTPNQSLCVGDTETSCKAVPVPAPIALIALGAAGIAGMRRRRTGLKAAA